MGSLNDKQEAIDKEWIIFMLTAKQAGLTLDEVRNFIRGNRVVDNE